MPVSLQYLSAGLSDPGRKRENNEDRFYIDAERGVYLVVDGVGGQNAGEKAAATAVAMIRARLERPTGAVADRIREAITLANNEIHRLAHAREEWRGMACVLTCAVLEDNGRATIGHVGDSRAYRLHHGELRKITHDHSPVGEREDLGELSEAEAMRHPRRNEVFRDVGSEPHQPDDANFIELFEIEVPADAALVLCSDGLSDLVDSAGIQSALEARAGDPRAAAQALIDAANAEGGKDNVTAIVVEGPRFASAVRALGRRPAAAAPFVEPPRPHWLARAAQGRLAFLAYGLLVACAAFVVLKPHYSDAGDGLRLALGPVNEPTTWTVGPGDQDLGGISEALAAARAGDRILVSPGRYTEQVRLKSGVELAAEKPREAIIVFAGTAVVADGVTGARLAGFRIEGTDAAPLATGVALNASDVELVDLEISGASLAGVDVGAKSTAAIRACRIVNNPGGGVVIRQGASPRLVSNLIAGNGKNPKAPRPGVEILDSAHPMLADNVIVDSGAEGIWTSALVPEAELVKRNFFGLGATDPASLKRRVRTVTR